MTTEQTTTERLAEALREIIAECPEPKLPYGRKVVEIARDALAAHEAQRGQSFMDWFTTTAGGDMKMEHCERAWNAAIASQPSLEREALEALRRLLEVGSFATHGEHAEAAAQEARAVLAKAERKP